MVLNYAMNDCKTKANSSGVTLRGEKWLENMRNVFRRDSGSVVGYFKPDSVTVRIFCPYNYLTGVGNCFGGIDQKATQACFIWPGLQ